MDLLLATIGCCGTREFFKNKSPSYEHTSQGIQLVPVLDDRSAMGYHFLQFISIR